jgi:hypothetical protein
MRCYCCEAQIALGRLVKLCPLAAIDDRLGTPDAAPARARWEECNGRWAVVCLACYADLVHGIGAGDTAGQVFILAGASRRAPAPLVNEAKYQAFQHREAARLGLQGDTSVEHRSPFG